MVLTVVDTSFSKFCWFLGHSNVNLEQNDIYVHFLFSGFSNFQQIIYSLHDELLFGLIIDKFLTLFDIGTNKSKVALDD